MREPKCALNLPIVIGQTPPCPVANPGPSGIGPQSRRPNSPLSRRYGRKPGIAVLIMRHIFNRSFRNDVNAGEISLRLQAECGKTTCRSTHECYGRLVSSQEWLATERCLTDQLEALSRALILGGPDVFD